VLSPQHKLALESTQQPGFDAAKQLTGGKKARAHAWIQIRLAIF
jgi:hypothetical protein